MAFRSTRAHAIPATLLASALAIAVLLWLYYPTIPRTAIGWMLLFVIGIPTWFLLEWIGGHIFEAQLFSRLGRVARIALAVPILVLFLILATYIIHFGQRVIAG